nr:hypothetical protein [Xanthomonas oryzae]
MEHDRGTSLRVIGRRLGRSASTRPTQVPSATLIFPANRRFRKLPRRLSICKSMSCIDFLWSAWSPIANRRVLHLILETAVRPCRLREWLWGVTGSVA